MYSFSKASKFKLLTCDERLQLVCTEALAIMDFTVICGERGEADQNKAFAEGKSHARYPESKHNRSPSRAVDIAPYNKGIDWDDINAFYQLAGVMKAMAYKHDINIKWGGDFEEFFDGAHYEIQGNY